MQSTGYRFPYGPFLIIAPFNFALEIPVLQMMVALITGNKGTMKPAVIEQFIRALIYCGMPASEVDLPKCTGKNAETLVTTTHFRMTQFKGSSLVANKLAVLLKGKTG
jgi:1-pyrroline-5-carboxylate dehydrogenase